VELPPGLPYDVAGHLLKRFQGFAKAEVKKMMRAMSESTSKHRHAPSGESVTAVFSGSESSESEEEGEGYAYGSPPDRPTTIDQELITSSFFHPL
jgi:hypothetical protein